MALVQRINNITGNLYSDEWYTDQETVDLCWELLKPDPSDIICCPFDSEQSLFVQKAKLQGNPVIYGIADFLENNNYLFDKLMTNPPFSIKDKVIEQVLKYGKPSILILPLDSLGGVKRHELYSKNKPFVYIPTRRISYYDQQWKKRPGAAFHSVILGFNTETTGITWQFEYKPIYRKQQIIEREIS
jgi:hypothetical protein